MARERTVNLAFPLAGLNRRMPYPQQPPYSTPDALNVRPLGSLDGRVRGGSRPGLCRTMAGQLGSGAPVRLLSTVRYETDAAADAFELWHDAFAGDTMGAAWAAASWGDRAIGLADTFDQERLKIAYADGLTGGINTATEELPIHGKSTSVYELVILPYRGQFAGTYHLYAKLIESGGVYLDPETTSGRGFRVTLTLTAAGAISGNTYYRKDDSTTFSENFTGSLSVDGVGPQVLQLKVTWSVDSYSWTVKLNSQELESYTPGVDKYDYTTNYGFGFAAKSDSSTVGYVLLDGFRARYKQYYESDETSDEPDQRPVVRTALVAIASTKVYREQNDGSMAVVHTGGYPLDGRYAAVDYANNLYMVFYDQHKLVKQSTAVASGEVEGPAILLDPLTDEEFARIDVGNLANGDRLQIAFRIPSQSANDIEGIYRIAAKDNAFGDPPQCKLTLGPAEEWAETPNWQLKVLLDWESHQPVVTIFGHKPWRYDPEAGWIGRWASDVGYTPYGCHLLTKYRERMVLAGFPETWWYMSRQGNPRDFDYAEDDAQAAVAGQLSEGGRMPQPLTALIPFEDDMMVFGCTGSIYVLRGDPAYGGQFDAAHHRLGIVDAEAWTFTPDGYLVILTPAGLMMLSPSSLMASGKSQFAPLLKESLPRELLNVSRDQYRVRMAYDYEDDGIHLFLTPEGQARRHHWWIDWTNKSIWPVDIPDDYSPTALLYRTETDISSDRGIILGGADGYLRRFHPTASKDQNTEISNYVLYGPFHLADGVRDGALVSLEATLAPLSGDVTWTLYTGESAEDAYSAATSAATGTWSAGLNYLSAPRARGPWAVLKLAAKSAECKAWAVERINAKLRLLGKHRKL